MSVPLAEPLDEGLHRTVAPNGCVILTERLPGVRSAAVGVWVRAASAHEPVARLGLAHCLEHMVFKGTERRSAHDLALALEGRGGSLDAFTGRDATSYQAHVLDADLPLAVDVLTDLVRRPVLREADLVLERNVILEEIAGVDDAPDDLVFELQAEQLWPGAQPYGRPILGTRETVAAIAADDLRALHGAHYHPGNCVWAAAGSVDHAAFVAALAAEGWLDGDTPEPRTPRVTVAPAVRGAERRVERELAQAHILLGTDTFAGTDRRRYALAMLVNVLGGGMSSRLFQRVREELGLCYAVYAFRQAYQAGGLLGTYVATATETADAAVDAIRAEYGRLAREGLPPAELVEARRQLQGQLMLALESPAARMGRLAGLALTDEPYRPLDAILAEIDAVSADTVAAVAAEFLDPGRQSLLRLGPP